MRQTFLVFLLALFLFAEETSAQSVLISPKVSTYTRPKPEFESKKTFTVRYPRVKASTPALSRRIESTLSYSKVLGLNIREEMSEYQWLEEADYEILYNKNGVLTIALTMFGSAAYPSGMQETLVIDLKNGNRMLPLNAFVSLPKLAALIRLAQQAEIVKSLKEIKDDPENNDVEPDALFEGKSFSVENLREFVVNDSGVTFIYDYQFPHVVKALQPEGRYSYSWKDLRLFIKQDGALGKFLR